MTRRREFLAVGGSALAAGLSGCLGSAGLLADGGPPDVREESGGPPDRRVPTAFPDLSGAATLTTLAVGRGSEHHQVWAWNATRASREVSVGIGGEPDAEPWFRETYALDAGANLAIDLREARQYVIRVSVGAGEPETTVEVPESRFDCNDSATDVAVREDEIASQTISTQEACGGGLL